MLLRSLSAESEHAEDGDRGVRSGGRGVTRERRGPRAGRRTRPETERSRPREKREAGVLLGGKRLKRVGFRGSGFSGRRLPRGGGGGPRARVSRGGGVRTHRRTPRGSRSRSRSLGRSCGGSGGRGVGVSGLARATTRQAAATSPPLARSVDKCVARGPFAGAGRGWVGRAPGPDGALRVREELLRRHRADVRGRVPDLEQLLGLVARQELHGLGLRDARLRVRHRPDRVPVEDVAGEPAGADGAPGRGRAGVRRGERGNGRGARARERGDGGDAARRGGEPEATRGGGHHRRSGTHAGGAGRDHRGRDRTDGTAAHTTARASRETRATSEEVRRGARWRVAEGGHPYPKPWYSGRRFKNAP